MIKFCKICKKQINIPLSKTKGYKGRQANRNFFCSRKCYKIYWKENVGMKGKKHWHWKGGNVKRKCEFCGKEFIKERNGKDRKYRFCSIECNGKWMKGKFIKERNPNWKGSPPNDSKSETLYKEWSKDIKSQDNWTCQNCGSKENLHAHHLRPYGNSLILRYDRNNGITLCKKCHHKIHSKFFFQNVLTP